MRSLTPNAGVQAPVQAQAAHQDQSQRPLPAPTLAERLRDLLRIEEQTLWTTRRLRVALVPLSQRRRTPV